VACAGIFIPLCMEGAKFKEDTGRERQMYPALPGMKPEMLPGVISVAAEFGHGVLQICRAAITTQKNPVYLACTRYFRFPNDKREFQIF